MPGLWLSGGEHSLIVPSQSIATNSAGGETAFGVDYTLQANHFLLNVGAGLQFWQSSFLSPDANVQLPGSVDLDGYVFTFVYDITDRQDTYTNIGVQVPLMLGAAFGNAYFLIGGKFCYSFLDRAAARMRVSTYGLYPQFLDPFTGMPEHQFFDSSPRAFRSSLPAGKMDAMASAEFGWQLLSPQRKGGPALCLSVYADFGFLNFFKTQSLEALHTPDTFVDNAGHDSSLEKTKRNSPAGYIYHDTSMIDGVTANHLLSTNAVADGIVHNLGVGIKLSLRFPHRQSKHSHYPCMCAPLN